MLLEEEETINAPELLADLIQELAAAVRSEIADLSPEELALPSDPGGNSIGVTVWHFSRWLDFIPVRAFADRPPEAEQWQTRGWAARTGYDPRGIGYAGLGALTGYSMEEVAAVPNLSADELLTYLDQVCAALRNYVLAMPPEALDQIAPGLEGKRTVYRWLKGVLIGCFGHVGEIVALKALRARGALATVDLASANRATHLVAPPDAAAG